VDVKLLMREKLRGASKLGVAINVDINGVIKTIQNTKQVNNKEILMIGKRELPMRESGQQYNQKVESVNNVVKVDPQCYAFTTETHQRKKLD